MIDQSAVILWGIVRECWIILTDSAPYVLLGFVIAALLKAVMPDDVVVRHLGRNGGWSVLKAALLGIPLPLCSCGVIPAAMGLRKQGASRGATVAFLVSTPETGVDSIAITWALLDPLMTVFRPIAAFVSAMLAGALENIFGPKDMEPQTDLSAHAACACDGDCSMQPAAHEHLRQPLVSRLKDSFNFAFIELLSDIGKWLALGIVLAAIVAYAVPDDFFQQHLGGGIIPMLIMLAVGIPLYVCATSSTPLAAALVMKGLSPGAALVFLIAGPATNVATMTVVGKTLGRRSLVIYLTSIAICALGMGMVLDVIYFRLGIRLIPAIAAGGNDGTGRLGIVSSIVLLGLIALSVVVSSRRKSLVDRNSPFGGCGEGQRVV